LLSKSFDLRRVVIIAISLIIGLVIGWLYGYAAARRRFSICDETPRSLVSGQPADE